MTALETLASTKSLGNVCALASQVRPDSAPAADSITQLQQQINKLLGMSQKAFAELVSSTSGVPVTDNGIELIVGGPVTY